LKGLNFFRYFIRFLKLDFRIVVFIVVLFIIGFPIALILAWAFEMSPEGFIRTTSPEAEENPYPDAKKKPLTSNLIIGLLVLALIGQFIYNKYWGANEASSTTSQNIVSANIGKSIAVLPFTNMSSDPEQDYFSDGVMEEILNHLVKIRDLKVISRTTMMQYKGTSKSLSDIAQELKVATLLEGSVRKAGDQIRITVQLIDGNTDVHIWSETYDRKMEDVFAIQSEVAQQVASTLQAEIQMDVKRSIENIYLRRAQRHIIYFY
ncbi:MAG: hypothetical protein O2951_19175, partial [Bacteroidetes bacterium]|nr:hypothetical protein [Bacteroidota bacterium]